MVEAGAADTVPQAQRADAMRQALPPTPGELLLQIKERAHQAALRLLKQSRRKGLAVA